jgi:hypothetical protein
MSDYISGYLYGRMLAQNPQLMQYAMKQQELEREQSQAQTLGDTLLKALGSDPTGNAQSMLEQQPMPEQQVAPEQQSSYNGEYADLINLASQKYGFTPQEIADTIRVESGFNPNAQSPTGPQGLMQLSAAAAQDVGLDPADRMDPAKNIMAGAAYAKRLKDEFGDRWRLAYHDGPGAVRSGNISPEGLEYVSKFNSPQLSSSPPVQGMPSVQPRSFQGGSKFMPSGVTGGEGVLGQDMDPVRRSYLHTIQQLVKSGNPMAVQMASELYTKMQEAHMQDIQRTALAKDISLTNEVPGTASFDRLVKQSLLKPGQQTIINNGQQGRVAATPMSDEEMSAFGLPTGPGHTKYIVDKNGMPQPVEAKSGTEAQSKAALYAGNMQSAHDILNRTQSNVDFTKLGVKHIINDVPWAGEFLASQYANPQLSEEEQMFDNAVEQFVAGVNRSESGATVTPIEWAKARNRFIPGKGDKPSVIAQKNKNREIATRLMMESGGILGQSQLEAFDKSIAEAKKVESSAPAKVDKPTVTNNLPELPPGYTWEN